MWVLLTLVTGIISLGVLRSAHGLKSPFTRRVGFGPDRGDPIMWEYDKHSDFSRFFVSGTNCFLELHRNKSVHKSVAKTMTTAGALDSDLVFVNIYDNTSVPQKVIGGFVSIKANSISKFKFLPFRMEDIDNILTFTVPDKSPEGGDFPLVDIPFPVPEGCMPNANRSRFKYNPSALQQPNDLRGDRRRFTHRIKDLSPSLVDFFTTVLFSLITHNKELKSKEKLDICTLAAWPPEAPFVLDRCCRIQSQLVYEKTFRDVEVRCSYPDQARGVLDVIATTLAILFTIISPLFLSWIPGTPCWKKGGEIQKKEGIMDSCSGSNLSTKRNNKTHIEDNHKNDNIADEDEDADELDGITEVKTVQAPLASLSLSSLGSEESTTKKSMTPSGGSSSATEESRVFLNSDPELRFSPSLVLGYLSLMHIDNKVVTVIRRFIFLFLCNALTGYVASISHLYYPSVLSNSVFYGQTKVVRLILRTMYHIQYEKYKYDDPDNIYGSLVLWTMVIILPFLVSVVQILLLYFIMVQPRDICEVLSWKENGKYFCKVLPERLQFKDPWDEQTTEGFQKILYQKMMARMACLTRGSFWIFWFHECFHKNFPFFDLQGSCLRCCNPLRMLAFIKYICLIPVHFIQLVTFILPMTSVLSNIFRQPHKILVTPSCGRKGRRYPYFLWMTFPMTFVGLVLTYLLILDFALFYAEAIVFFLIDILRNSEKSLPSVIFAVSLMVYMRMAFVQFEDDYRRLKAKVIQLCEDMTKEAERNGAYVFFKETPTTELLLISDAGDVSIPRDLFDKIVHRFMPYKPKVVKTVLELGATLGLVAFLFYVALQFQFFHTFTAVGETFLTGLMVSVPRLLGMLKSAGYNELKEKQREKAIEAFITSHVLVEDRPT